MKTAVSLLTAIMIGIFQLNAQDMKLKVTIGQTEFTATLNDNQTTRAFIELLPMTVNMNEMGGYEKYYYLPQNLPGSASNVGTTYEGDLMIWSGNCLVLFYVTRSTSYSYIRLGRIDNTTGLREALGSGNALITFELKDPDPEDPDPEDPTTGIEDVVKESDLYKVYPNPVTDYIHVSGKFEQLQLFNINGTLLKQTKESTIHAGYLSSGIYLLKIYSEKDGTSTKKIIKK